MSRFLTSKKYSQIFKNTVLSGVFNKVFLEEINQMQPKNYYKKLVNEAKVFYSPFNYNEIESSIGSYHKLETLLLQERVKNPQLNSRIIGIEDLSNIIYVEYLSDSNLILSSYQNVNQFNKTKGFVYSGEIIWRKKSTQNQSFDLKNIFENEFRNNEILVNIEPLFYGIIDDNKFNFFDSEFERKSIMLLIWKDLEIFLNQLYFTIDKNNGKNPYYVH